MQAQHHSGSAAKATTQTIHLLGHALIGFQVTRSQASRERLQQLATLAQRQGELTDNDAQVIASQLSVGKRGLEIHS